MSEDLNKKTGKATLWSSVTEIVTKLIVPIVNIILARLLAPEAFGAVATITMVITFAEVFTDAGFQKYIVQHNFESEEELNRGTDVAFITNLVISVLISALITVFRHPIARFVGSPSLGDAIAVSSLTIIMVAFSSIQMARFKRDLDFKSLFFVRMGASLVPLLVTVPLAFALRNFWALVIGTLATNLFNAVVLTVRSRWKPKLFYSFKLFKEMFSFTAWTLLESILIWLTVNIDIFLVGNALSDYYLGIYKTSMTTVNSYMAIISGAVAPVLFSALSRYQDDDTKFRETYWHFFKFTAIIAIPMSVGVFVYRDLVTDLLLGAQWGEAAGFIGLWGLMSGITVVFSNFSSEVYRAKGNPKLSMLAQALHIAFIVPAVIISLKFGFSALYITRSLMRLQFVIVNILFMRLIYKFSVLTMMKNIFPSFVASLGMAVAGCAFISISSSMVWQIFSVFLCIITYFGLLLCFPKTRKEILELPWIQRRIKRNKGGTK